MGLEEASSGIWVSYRVGGGGRGIRTPGTLSGTAVFKTACFNRSHIPPRVVGYYLPYNALAAEEKCSIAQCNYVLKEAALVKIATGGSLITAIDFPVLDIRLLSRHKCY